jgi:hypothetical protein
VSLVWRQAARGLKGSPAARSLVSGAVGVFDCIGGAGGLGGRVNQVRKHHRHRDRRAAGGPAGGATTAGPLAEIVRECEAGRQALGEAPGQALRDFWRKQDSLHGKRADYLLWRQIRGAEVFRGNVELVGELAVRALRSGEAQIRWGGLSLLPALPPGLKAGGLVEAVKGVLGMPGLKEAGTSCEWVRWLGRVWLETGGEASALMGDLQQMLMKVQAGWKPGRALHLELVSQEAWWPVEVGVVKRWLGRTMVRLVRAGGVAAEAAAAWLVSAWLLRREGRPAGSLPGAGEVELLLDAGCAARAAGDGHEAWRLTALALQLLPPRAPERLLQRCRVAAWRLAEAGLLAPEGLKVRLDELAFSGDPPDSEKGREAAALYCDEEDPARAVLLREVESDADWQVLRASGVVLHHPLAALGWIGKKAASHAVKKQHGLLEAAARLALRHHCLGSAGKMLAVWPGNAERVLEFARMMRESVKKVPVLRDAEVWAGWAGGLRAAWGRLEVGGIADEEALFFLHETLVDREETTWRCLPGEVRALEGQPRALALVLEADLRLMRVLEHQRTVELWEVGAMLRERADLSGSVWVSAVLRGEAGAGRYQVMVQGASGRALWQGRVKAGEGVADYSPMLDEVVAAVKKAAPEVQRVLVARDVTLPELPWGERLGAVGDMVTVVFVPSWERAFRELREGVALEALS